jgi:hypothetical protein
MASMVRISRALVNWTLMMPNLIPRQRNALRSRPQGTVRLRYRPRPRPPLLHFITKHTPVKFRLQTSRPDLLDAAFPWILDICSCPWSPLSRTSENRHRNVRSSPLTGCQGIFEDMAGSLLDIRMRTIIPSPVLLLASNFSLKYLQWSIVTPLGMVRLH